MSTLLNIISALSMVISAGAICKIITLFIQRMVDTDDKSQYKDLIKNVFIVLIISVLVAGTSVTAIMTNYFG